MTRKVLDDRPVGILHGASDRTLALRVLADARGFGVGAVLIPQSSPDPEWSHVRGLVVVHGPTVQWSADELDAIHALKSNGVLVALVRLSSRRIPPALHGLSTLGLWDRNYKVSPSTGAPGHRLLVEIFGQGREPEGTQRRGFVFVSYRGCDADWVAGTLVPALAEQEFGFFDYRGTEELDEATLAAELARWVHECAVLLVVASRDWSGSAHTIAELQQARAIDRPVVVVRRRSWPTWPRDQGPATATVRFDDPVRDGSILATTILAAVQSG